MIHILPEALPQLIMSDGNIFKCKLCCDKIGDTASPRYDKLDGLLKHLETKHKTVVQVKNGRNGNRTRPKG